MVNLNDANKAIQDDAIDSLPWSSWKKMSKPEDCRLISGPLNAGVYQIRSARTQEYIQFGIGVRCQERMQSLFPAPYGTSGRNNIDKRQEILKNWMFFEYRTLATFNKAIAKLLEDHIKSKKNHKYNT